MTTMEEVRYVHFQRKGCEPICADDINQLVSQLTFDNWLYLRLRTDIESAQIAMRRGANAPVLQKRIDHAQELLAQLDIAPEDRDLMLGLEIAGLEEFFHKLSRSR